VPFPPGAFNDTLGRTIANKFTDSGFGQAVVDNRPGAGSTLGADLAAKSPPDGHTLLIVAFPFAVNATLYTKLPYNTEKDFVPIIHAGATPNLLVAHPSVPVNSVKELIALAKSKPGQLTYASTGSGSSNHISMELFKMMTRTNIVHVPYKGSAPALTDMMGGHVMMMFDNTPNVLPHVRSGKIKALAVTSSRARRSRRKFRPSMKPACRAMRSTYGSAWSARRAFRATPFPGSIARSTRFCSCRMCASVSAMAASSRSAARRKNSASTCTLKSSNGAGWSENRAPKSNKAPGIDVSLLRHA